MVQNGVAGTRCQVYAGLSSEVTNTHNRHENALLVREQRFGSDR
jgi:hypothetical protein